MPTEPTDFEKAFEAHAPFAWRSLARLGVPERDLEDVCQEVFVVVLKRLPSFEGRSALRTWIYGICRGVAANHRRRVSHQRELPAQDVVELAGDHAQDASALDALLARESRALLEALLAQLPEAQREVLVLYEIEELTAVEIAEALDCPQSTVFSRLYAARAAIANALKRLRAQRKVA
jgi:RNA polymerase sigma-70 factor (ECF subfamily)